ncbi:MAG: ATPase domain-containing protein, partial [Desulfobacteraceae bacterium]
MKQESPFSSDARVIRKTPTQIHGLDAILQGGFPTQRMTLITGGPGTGKSLLGLEFVYRGAVAGEPGIFVTFEEPGENVRQNAGTLGWDLAALEQAGSLFLLDARVDPEMALSGEFNLGGITAILEGKVREMGARRIVIDALDGLTRFFEDPNQEQNQLLGLHQWLTERGLTAVFTSKAQGGNESRSPNDFLDFLADCVLALDQEIKGRVATKMLRVIKYRGSPYGGNAYPFLITEEGCRFNPITDMVLHSAAPAGMTTSGDRALDEMLGGGYHQGRCVLIAGAPGTGKTTLASMFVRSACEKGEKVLYVSYEESQSDLIQGMRSVGIDLKPALEDACLEILALMPESTGVEEHLFLVQQAMERLQP